MNDVLEFAVNVSKSIFSFVYFVLMLVSSVAFIYILVAFILNSIIPVLNFEMPYPGMYSFGSPVIPILIAAIAGLGVTVVFGSIGILFSMHSRLESMERTLKSIERKTENKAPRGEAGRQIIIPQK